MVGLVSVGRLLGGRNSGFSPLSLFAAGEQGVWYDPSDFSTMFQDSGGTTPVTAVDQPVGLIRDKSGRGNHASQATNTSRPVLKIDGSGRYYLAFDGTDDSLATGTISPGSVDKAQVFAGVRKLSDAAAGVVAETSAAPNTTNGTFALLAPTGASTSIGFYSRGTTQQGIGATGYTSPLSMVITGVGDISGDVTTTRANGVVASNATADQGTGNYLSYPLYIGRRGGTTLPFNGNLYSLIVRFSAANLDAGAIAKAETWVNGKTGAY